MERIEEIKETILKGGLSDVYLSALIEELIILGKLQGIKEAQDILKIES